MLKGWKQEESAKSRCAEVASSLSCGWIVYFYNFFFEPVVPLRSTPTLTLIRTDSRSCHSLHAKLSTTYRNLRFCMTHARESPCWHRSANLAGRVAPSLHPGSQTNSLKLTVGCALMGTFRAERVERIALCGREASDLLTLMHKAPKTHMCFTAPCRDLYFHTAQTRDGKSSLRKKSFPLHNCWFFFPPMFTFFS